MIDELIALVGKPAEPAYPTDSSTWEAVEVALGITLPTDYKEMISTLGSGEFGGYVTLYNPQAPRFDFKERVEGLRRLYLPGQQAFPEYSVPFKLYPDKEGLLPIGLDDNGGLICFEPWESPTGKRIIFIDGEFDTYDIFEGTISEFLVAWLKRDYAPRFYPEDTPVEEEPLFQTKVILL